MSRVLCVSKIARSSPTAPDQHLTLKCRLLLLLFTNTHINVVIYKLHLVEYDPLDILSKRGINTEDITLHAGKSLQLHACENFNFELVFRIFFFFHMM